MIQHHGLEWYGEGATFAEVCNDYTKVEYKCNGIGVLYDYALFLGIDLILWTLIVQTPSVNPFQIKISLKFVITKRGALNLN